MMAARKQVGPQRPAEESGPLRPVERTVTVNGQPCRVWEAGQGEPLGYLAGLGGFPLWPPVLERLAARRRVICPSLPGFPGARGHEGLDTHLDWLLAVRDLLNAAGLPEGDLVGVSVGGALAADVAALWPHKVRKLALVGPYGLYDAAQPVADVFALAPGQLAALVCNNPARFLALTEPPEGADPGEWEIEQVRAMEAAARILWPLGDTRLARRLPRILCPTLLLWGEADRVVPPAYAQRFAAGIAAGSAVPAAVRTVPGAGHLADVDAPDAVAEALLEFLG
jgi:pimeloyl-ACP methyl ester carboxylesterase